MKNKSLMMIIAILIIAMSSMAQKNGTFTDSRDNKTYKTVKIGTQIWLAENLAYKASSGCWVYDNNQSNVTTYGYLYNWETAKNVCPLGWHLPSDDEWTTLTTYLGGESVAGVKLKEAGTMHWKSPNDGATDETGFTDLPGGCRDNGGSFNGIGSIGDWWSSSESRSNMVWNRSMSYAVSLVIRLDIIKGYGFSVRCVRDN